MNEKLLERLDNMSDKELGSYMTQIVSMAPWQGAEPGSLAGRTDGSTIVDEDGFRIEAMGEDFNYQDFQKLQQLCWTKFNRNPFVYTTVVDNTGRIAGKDFSMGSTDHEIQMFMEEIWEDPRNHLVLNFEKYVARNEIQGELFLCATLHKSGFVEIDFISPSSIRGFKDNSGILKPKGKPLFPLMYRVEVENDEEIKKTVFIPSINMAYYPEMWKELDKIPDWKTYGKLDDIQGKKSDKVFSKLNGYTQFILHFDQGFVTTRNVSRLKTAMEWLNYYDNLKKWEIDHKKSSGAYLWTIEVEDRAAFRLWLSMSDEEKAKTGLMSKKTPGGTVMLPPGFKMTCNNPKLSPISNQDNDILDMVSAGLNTAEDQMTGSSSGSTYGGVKMSRGPLSDRIQDKIAGWERWMIHGFWKGVFHLAATTGKIPETYKERKAYTFKKKEPKFKNFTLPVYKSVFVNFPTSAMSDLESTVKALMGVKHGAVNKTLGISDNDIAKRIGFQNLHQSRLDSATESDLYPDNLTDEEVEQLEEGASEPGLKDDKNKDKKPDTPPVDDE